MPILKNPAHELMAQSLAKGMAQTEAHKEAGYSGNRKSASNLMKKNPQIQERVDELLEESAKETGMTLENLDKEILAMVQAAKEEPVYGDDGLLGTKVNFAGLMAIQFS